MHIWHARERINKEPSTAYMWSGYLKCVLHRALEKPSSLKRVDQEAKLEPRSKTRTGDVRRAAQVL